MSQHRPPCPDCGAQWELNTAPMPRDPIKLNSVKRVGPPMTYWTLTHALDCSCKDDASNLARKANT